MVLRHKNNLPQVNLVHVLFPYEAGGRNTIGNDIEAIPGVIGMEY